MADTLLKSVDEKLADHRRKIDAIDKKLVKLLHDRQQVVADVGALKAEEGLETSIIRPGREANMVRAIAQKGTDDLPGEMLAHIWRQIISAAINLEEHTNIAVVGTSKEREAYWIAREHFGAFTPIDEQPTDTDVTQKIIAKQSTVGIISIEETGVGQPWWRILCDHEDRPMVFARLPFIRRAPTNRSPLVAVGHVIPEPTSSDESIWAFYIPERISERAFEDAFREQELGFETLDSHKEWGTTIATYYLVMLEDYADANDPRIAKVLNSLNYNEGIPHPNQASAEWLGAYATPILFYDETAEE